jgi:hypothetical protein
MTSGLRSLFRRSRVEEDEQLRGFPEMASEEKMKQGMSRENAFRAVRLDRGSLEVTKEVVRPAYRWLRRDVPSIRRTSRQMIHAEN